MDWKEFIIGIQNGMIDNSRYSDYTLSNKTGIDRNVFYKIRKEVTKEPQKNTIDLLEKAFDIFIDDSNKGNITYQRKKDNEYSKGRIGISAHELISVDDIHTGLQNMSNIYFTKIKEEYITDLYKVGQAVIFDPLAKIEDNDELIIKISPNYIMIKQCTLDENNLLYVDKEDGYKIRKIPFKEIECYYKIIGSMKIDR